VTGTPPSAPPPALVATKLYLPAVRPGAVPRRRIVAQLAGTERKLVLVCAPPGWGKTVLLSEWNASRDEPRPFAWVSLDPGDDDPARFWSYVIGALQTVEPGVGADAAAALPGAGAGLVDTVLPPLLNDLAHLPSPLVLVLDDYHSVRSEQIHQSLAYLLRHLPRTLRVALASRADPPLPLAGLRAAGELVEIRAAELRFSTAEADALLNGSLGLELDPDDVALLQTRTEGWAAGLQLAALSLGSREDRHAFVQEFAGDDRQIGDYLHEVLADLPQALREFLLRCSILERMSAPLCDAVTDAGDSAERLEHAERLNLFLVPLDSQRRWYRFHHLFRDLLRHELDRSSPGLAGALHRRAAAWYRDEGDADGAIAHATAAGDFAEACELIRGRLEETSALGQYETIARWIDALPAEVARADTSLCTSRAWCALHLGRLDEAAEWRRGFEHDRSRDGAVGDERSPAFAALAFDAGYASRRGDVGQALRAAQAVVTAFPDEADPRRSYAELNLGEVLFYAGRLADAAACLEGAVGRVVAEAQSPFTSQALLHGSVYLAAIRAELGELDQAERAAAEAERLIRDEHHGERHPNAVFLLVARGKLLGLRGDSVAAEASLTRAEELHRRVGWPLDRAYTLIQLAVVKRRLGKLADARALAREARHVVASCPDPGMLGGLLLQAERSLRLAPAPAGSPVLPGDLGLSERELAILRLLAGSLSQREIGSELYISLNTVKGHVRSIFRKLGVNGRAEAVARGRELGLV